jgi:hypothetical protein
MNEYHRYVLINFAVSLALAGSGAALLLVLATA